MPRSSDSGRVMALSPGGAADGGDSQFNRALDRLFGAATLPNETFSRRELNQYTDNECDEFDSVVPPLVRQTHPTVEDVGAPFGGWAKADTETTLAFEDIKLIIPAGALLVDTLVTIRPIPDRETGALDEGMTNVVPGGRAFRLGPHGLFFQKPITLIVPFDRSLIPPGMSEEDLHTFYFDDEGGRWRRIRVREVRSDGFVIAETEHFTDFINATIAVPDHPTASSFDQNTIASLKLGDPAAGLELIGPPAGASDGAAHLSYRFNIPPGRRGMQPDLTLEYDSNAGNGWMGLGWNIPISKIQVDTRFGVPRYSTSQESELYEIDGSELTPVGATQGPRERALAPEARQAERQFVRRMEGSFSKIIRHGSSPLADTVGSYTWEVIDKNGIRYFYGTKVTTQLADPTTGAIAEWLLTRVEDPFSNRIEYEYQSDSSLFSGKLGGAQPWVQLYPEVIRYTSAQVQSTMGTMFVRFELEPKTPERPDAFHSARQGFLARTARRLHAMYVVYTPNQFGPGTYYEGMLGPECTIDSRPCDQLVRRYLFTYTTGEYQKSLLKHVDVQGIGQRGAGEFLERFWQTDHRTTLDYYQRPPASSPSFAPSISWGTLPNDQALARTSGDAVGANLFVGAGICKAIHGGAGGGFQIGGDSTSQAFLDFTGDGLPDFLRADQIFLGHRAPSAPILVSSTNLSDELITTSQTSFSVNAGLHELADHLKQGVSYSWSTSNQKGGFADVDGDGFVDWITPAGQIRRNTGNGTTSASGSLTLPSTALDPAVQAAIDAQSPRANTVVRWTAPYKGRVALGGPVQRKSSGNDVLAEIWRYGEGSPRWSHVFGGTELTPCTPGPGDSCTGGLIFDDVEAGDRFYFRTRAQGDIAGTALSWDPQLSYQTVCDEVTCAAVGAMDHLRVEPWGAPVFDFSQASDFRLAGPPHQAWQAQVTALTAPVHVAVSGVFEKTAPTAEDVTVEVYKKDSAGTITPLFSQLVPAAEPTNPSQPFSIDVAAQIAATRGPIAMNAPLNGEPDRLYFRVLADSPVDPAAFEWDPEVTYLEYCRNPPVENSAQVCGAVSCSGGSDASACTMIDDPMPQNPLRRGQVVYRAPVTYSTYLVTGRGNGLHLKHNQPTVAYPAPEAGVFEATLTYSLASTVPAGQTPPPGDETILLVQGNQRLHGKVIVPPGAVGSTTRASVVTAAGEPLYFTALRKGNQELQYSVELRFAATGHVYTVSPSALNVHRVRAWDDEPEAEAAKDQLSGGYHQWSAGQWTERSGAPTFSGTAVETQGFDPRNPSASPVTPALARPQGLSPLQPDLATFAGPVWVSSGVDLYIAAGEMKPSRSGANPTGIILAASAPAFRKSHGDSTETDISANAPPPISIGGGIAGSNSSSSGDTDTLDLNGDRYADWLDGSRARFGDSRGNLGAPEPIGLGAEVRKFEGTHLRYGISAGSSAGLKQSLDGSGNPSATGSLSASAGRAYGRTRTRKELLDINGDGLPDRVERSNGNAAIRVRLNLGYSFGPEFSLPSDGGFSANVPSEVGNFTAQSDDKNALRLQTDVTNSIQGGLGVGFPSNAAAGVGFNAGGGLAYTGTRTVVDLADVNGDGLPDRVLKIPGQGVLSVQLNLGERFAPEQAWVMPAWGSELPSGGPLGTGSRDVLSYTEGTEFHVDVGGSYEFVIFLAICGVVEAAAQYRNYNTTSQLVFEDVDGDGFSDQLLKNDATGAVHVKLNQDGAQRFNLLKTVENPIGSRITLEYGREGNTPELPQNHWVLTSVTVDDGLTGAFHDTPRTTTFQYGGGLYNRAEREFFGFANVTTVRPDASKVVQTFRQDAYCTKGLLIDAVEEDGAGRLFRRARTAHELRPAGAADACFPAAIEETSLFYDGVTTDLNQPSKTLSEQRDYDDSGNVTYYSNAGDDGSGDDVSYTVVYDPDPALAANHIVRPQTVTAVDGLNRILRQRTATYYAHGGVHTIHDLVNGGHDPATGAPYVNQVTPDWVFTYNLFGLLDTSTDPTGFQLVYTYDSETDSYVTSTTDSFGFTSTQVPDPALGVFTSITDINGFTQKLEYDRVVPRLAGVWAPTENPADPPQQVIRVTHSQLCPVDPATCVGGPERPAYTKVEHYDARHPNDWLETVTFIDGLGRVIQAKKEVDIDDGAGSVTHGYTVSGLTVYDARGRVQSQGQPTFSTDPGTTLSAPVHTNPTQYRYDILSRPTHVATPNGGITTSVYGFAPFDGVTRFTTTVTDPNNNPRTTYQDIRGQVVGIAQVNTLSGVNTTLTTRYQYNPLGELLEVRDAKNNATTSVYDTLGHLVDLTSPDSGHTSYRYDLAGRLRAKQTPKLAATGQAGQVITFGYQFNRLETIDLPSTPGVVDYQYTYGEPDYPEGQRGRLVLVQDPSGTEERDYDQLGRINLSAFTPTRQSTSAPLVTYTTRFTHDVLNRLLTLTYPDSEIVLYDYDGGGALRAVVGQLGTAAPTIYVQSITYDHFGQRKRINLGNGAVTRYTYDPAMRWLTDIDTTSAAITLQANHYTFDLVGNILTAANEIPVPAPVPPNGPIAPGPTTQTFTYDKLYQLTSATGRYDGCACGCNNYRQYTFAQTYDEIGNIKNKTVTDNIYWPNGQVVPQPKTTYNNTYLYQTPRPHAPSKIGAQNLTYDPNGNQIASAGSFEVGREITWNDLDQLTKEVDSGFTNTYLYNSAGERTHKRRTTLETVYVNQYYVIRNLLFQTKHIYAGPTRIASATKTLSSFNPPSGSAVPVLYYYHSDHLGSTGYLTDKNGVIVEHEEYLPSGEEWFEELRNGSASNRLPWKFNGKELDETGLYYYGARYYNPRVGVWLSPDPIFGGGVDEPGHLALYTYSSNNPVNLIDPTGLEDIPVNQGPKGAKPGARFFADASKGGGVVNFNDAASFDAAAQGHQTYRYDPQGGLDPDVATTLAGLKAAMGQPSGAWQDVVAGAGLANAAAPGDVRLDGTGSSRGLPGGACETCRGSTAAQVVYVAGTALTAVLGAAIAAGENAVASAARSAARISKDVKCYGMCQEFADRLQSALSKKGIGGVRMTIRVRKYGRLVSDTVGPVAETGMLHEAIRVGDTVFDNLRPKGMPLGEFLRDLGLPAPGAAEIAEKAF